MCLLLTIKQLGCHEYPFASLMLLACLSMLQSLEPQDMQVHMLSEPTLYQ